MLLAALSALGWLTPTWAEAQPSPPATFSGTASIDGKPAPDGTAIHAFIGDRDCTQPGAPGTVHQGTVALYRIEVLAESQMPGCGSDGRVVTFTVGGHPANQTANWKAALQTIDLTAAAGTPGAGASPTQSASATTSNATAVAPGRQTPASPVPLITVGSGTPETAVLNSDSPAAEKPASDSRSIVAVVGIVVAGFVAVTGAIWWWRYWRGRRRTGERFD